MTRMAPALLLLPLALLGAASARAAVPAGVAAASPPAQQPAAQAVHRVTGRVTRGASGTPIEGVTVRVQGAAIGTITNAEGSYTLNAPAPTSTLVFSRIGFVRQEIPIAGRAQLDVALEPAAVSLEGVAVVGYQTVATEKLTGAVTVADVEQIKATPANSPIKALQGRIAGLSVTAHGDPGGIPSVQIRGLKTLGNNDPLYVIDGIPSKSAAAQQLKPEDIESIQVLKDAASASIYGSRASNGVIVITTKSALRQPLEINYSSHVTTSSHATRLDVLNTQERGRALWQAAVNDGVDPATLPIYQYDWTRNPDGTATLNRVIVPEFVGDPAQRIRAADTDWYDAISRTGVIQAHNLSAATSGERGGALLSLGLFDDEGIVRGTDYRRLNGRINSSYNFFNKRLTIGENLAITHGALTPVPSGLGGNPLALGLIAQPILPVRTEDGNWAGPSGGGFDDRDNPVMLIDINQWDRNRFLQSFGNIFAKYDVTPNLQANARFGLDYQNGENRDIQRRYQAGFLRRDVNSLNSFAYTSADWTFNSTLNYAREAGRHSATLLGGFEAVHSSFSNMRTYREGFAIETEEYFVENAGTGLQAVAGDRGGYSLVSFFGKADYDYDNKYLATFTLRQDGSSRFGANNRYGTFPAVTLGWRLSKEAFFPSEFLVSDLKLRYGWGKAGNQEIANTAAYALYVPGYGDDKTWGPSNSTAYDIRGQDRGNLPSGFFRTQTGNPDLRWEATTESNVGLDFRLFGDRVSGSLDYFDRTTSDILIRPAYVAVIGNGGDRWANGATMKTRGAELSARYEHTAGDLTFGVSGNASGFRDRITKLPEAVVRSYPGNEEQTILGRSVNSIFGYVVQGIFQDAAEVDAAATQPGKAVGRLRYRDLNGDGKIDALDQKYLGTTNPKLTYGLSPDVSYKQFSLSLFLQGVHGPSVYNGIKSQTDFTSIFTGANFGRRVLRAWTPQNRGSDIPALSLANTNNETRSSTYFVEDGSYLKLREVVLAYRLSGRALPRQLSVLDGGRLFVRGGNLFTVKSSGTTLPDPELPFAAYPLPRTFTLGLDVSF